MHAAAACLLIVAAAGTVLLGQADPFILAADSGTHLQPLAQLRGTEWTPIRASGLGRLAPRDWTRWSPRGGSTTVRLTVREPTGRCAVPRLLPVAGSAVPSGARRFVGLAASGPLEVEPVTPVGDGEAGWALVAASAADLFERREREHGVSSSAMASAPVTLDRAYQSGHVPGAFYYEASKRLFDDGNTPEDDPRGIVRITVSGWLRREGSGLVPAGTKSELYWDPVDEPVAVPDTALMPLGVIRQGADRIWVMHGHTGVRDSFTLYAVGSSVRRLLSVDAAEC